MLTMSKLITDQDGRGQDLLRTQDPQIRSCTFNFIFKSALILLIPALLSHFLKMMAHIFPSVVKVKALDPNTLEVLQ